MRSRRAVAAVLLPALLGLFLLPGVAAAHSELETSGPADGATLTAPPAEIVGNFSEELDAARSSMELRGPDGGRIATGGVPADGPPTRMAISGLPTLAPGVYQVRWTTVTADDNGVERGTFSFSLVEVVATPTPAPSASSASSTTAVASARADASPAPSAAPTPGPAPAAGAGDLLLPIAVLVAVVAAGALVLLRRRR